MPRFQAVTTLVEQSASAIIAFTRTSVGFATIANDQQLRTFDASGKALATKRASSGGMLGLAACIARPDGGAVLSATTKITQYDAATAKPGLQYKGHGGKTEVTALAYLGDGRLASAALVNIANTKANSVCIWAEDGALLHTIHLPSGRPKDPCQPQRMVRAGSTDTLIALGWAARAEPSVTPGTHLFRIEPNTQTVTRIATLWAGDPLVHTTVYGMAATDDRVILALHTTVDVPSGDMNERTWTTEIRILDLEGNTVASDVSPTQPIRSPLSIRRAVAVSSDGTLLAVAGNGVELRALPSLELLDRLEAHFAEAFQFEDGALLFSTSQGIFRAPIA